VRDWRAFVRERLRLPGLAPEREARIVRELAAQLEDFYRDARAAGASHDEADAHACRQVPDWDRMAADLLLADRANARPLLERAADTLDDRSLRAGRERSGASGDERAQRSERGGVQGPPPLTRGGRHMIADALRDAGYAIRQLTRSPGFAVAALLTLALGIGATSAMFSVVNGVLLKPLPVPESERLVRVNEIVPQYGRFSVAPANFLDWRAQNTSFERIVAITSGTATFTGADGPERVSNATVSWDFFEMAKAQPSLGRGFRAEEDVPGKNNVIVLSHRSWQRRFGADPNIVGRGVTLSGVSSTVVGVAPPGFEFPRDAEYWVPLALDTGKATRGGHFLAVIARLKPGVTPEQAGAEMKTIAERLATQYPDTNGQESAEVVPLLEQTVGSVRESLLALFAAVGVVILIVCANVANLLLVRASVRDKEIAIRTALGAGRGRLVRQMLAESVILAVAGGTLGVLFAYLVIRPIQTLSAGSIPRVQDVSLDATVLLFALAVSLATGVLFGLVPAWQASRASVAGVLKEGGRSSATGGGRWTRNALLVAEVALSLVLLVGAALLLRSFARLGDVDPGFRAEGVLTFRVSLPQQSYQGREKRTAFFDTLLTKLEALPQVRAAGMTQTLPMRGDYMLSFEIQGRPDPPPNAEPSANYRVVSPNYFSALGVPLKRGRWFTARDNMAKAPLVAVVDEAFVARHFPDEDPIGRGLDIGNGSDGYFEIVGVVGDVRSDALDVTPKPTMYAPFGQDAFGTMWILASTDGDPTALTSLARQTLREIDPTLPAYSIAPLATAVSDSVAQRRFSMLLLAAFAGVALFLAAVGIYGVVAYGVTQRTQEIGVRMAIGAERRDVLALVIGGGLKLALLGIAIGLAGALALSRLIETMLFDVRPFDPPSYAATAALLLVIAAFACYMPARRAMKIDPIIAIRQE
jgi:putative ABC transport system permease protein